MPLHVEPALAPAQVAELKPTQMTVGFHEVQLKKAKLQKDFAKKDAAQRLGANQVPVVIGPGGQLYLIDHHHLSLALLQLKQKHVLTRIEADLSHLTVEAFWPVMDARDWCHTYDASGRRRKFAKIPKHLDDLVDDPYRSLAGMVERAGGCAKSQAPFSEFQWADFLRRAMDNQLIRNWELALEKALDHARSKDAQYLPGWCGVRS
jgi:hypothetical protein